MIFNRALTTYASIVCNGPSCGFTVLWPPMLHDLDLSVHRWQPVIEGFH